MMFKCSRHRIVALSLLLSVVASGSASAQLTRLKTSYSADGEYGRLLARQRHEDFRKSTV